MVDRQDDRSDIPLEEAIVEEFATSFGGELIRPEDVGYEEARKVYNGMIDKSPALIVRPTGSVDVIDAVNLARDNGLPLAVRCGGHSVAGKEVGLSKPILQRTATLGNRCQRIVAPKVARVCHWNCCRTVAVAHPDTNLTPPGRNAVQHEASRRKENPVEMRDLQPSATPTNA